MLMPNSLTICSASKKEKREDILIRKDESSTYGENVDEKIRQGITRLQVDTELPGGESAARNLFRQLTGQDIPKDSRQFKAEVGDRSYQFRVEGRSGHPKIDINSSTSDQLISEKITFK